jgi:hypothetical protein
MLNPHFESLIVDIPNNIPIQYYHIFQCYSRIPFSPQMISTVLKNSSAHTQPR